MEKERGCLKHAIIIFCGERWFSLGVRCIEIWKLTKICFDMDWHMNHQVFFPLHSLSIVRILLNSSTCHFSKTQMTIAAHNLISLTSWLFVARFVVSVRCNAILKPQSKLCLDIFIIYVIQTISAGLGIFVWN